MAHGGGLGWTPWRWCLRRWCRVGEGGGGRSRTTERGIGGGDNTARAGLYESMEVEAGLQLANAKQFQFVFSRPMSDGIIQRGTQWLQFTDRRGFTWAASRRCHDDVYSCAGGWQGWPITEFGEGPLLSGFPSWGLQGMIGRVPRVLQGLGPKPIPTTPVLSSIMPSPHGTLSNMSRVKRRVFVMHFLLEQMGRSLVNFHSFILLAFLSETWCSGRKEPISTAHGRSNIF